MLAICKEVVLHANLCGVLVIRPVGILKRKEVVFDIHSQIGKLRFINI